MRKSGVESCSRMLGSDAVRSLPMHARLWFVTAYVMSYNGKLVSRPGHFWNIARGMDVPDVLDAMKILHERGMLRAERDQSALRMRLRFQAHGFRGMHDGIFLSESEFVSRIVAELPDQAKAHYSIYTTVLASTSVPANQAVSEKKEEQHNTTQQESFSSTVAATVLAVPSNTVGKEKISCDPVELAGTAVLSCKPDQTGPRCEKAPLAASIFPDGPAHYLQIARMVPPKNSPHFEIIAGRSYYAFTESDLAHYREAFPLIDVDPEFAKMSMWLDANQRRLPHGAGGAKRFVLGWLGRTSKNAEDRSATIREISVLMNPRAVTEPRGGNLPPALDLSSRDV